MSPSETSEKPEKSELFKAIDEGDTEKAKELLKTKEDAKQKDSSGMSVLSAAAYRGNTEIAVRAIELGCDVNSKTHDTFYTPLMFAALSGKPEMCKLLMDHGARMYLVNSIGKTASELAAFIGQHECVAIINNHITVEEIEAFLRPKVNGKEVEDEEKYPDDLAEFIHSLCSSHEVHPVKIIFRMSKFKDAMRYKKKILYVIDRVFEKQLRCKEGNEVMSLKLWIILFFMRESLKYIENHPEVPQEDAALQYAKLILKWEAGDEVRRPLDVLLRNSVAAFPYKHSLVYDNLLKSLTKSPIGMRPPAFDHIVQSLFGQRILMVSQFCSVCGCVAAKKRCPQCKINYCSQECQKFDWSIHKKVCASVKTVNEKYADDGGQDAISLDDIQAQIGNINV